MRLFQSKHKKEIKDIPKWRPSEFRKENVDYEPQRE